jgi:hypothetical protein
MARVSAISDVDKYDKEAAEVLSIYVLLLTSHWFPSRLMMTTSH